MNARISKAEGAAGEPMKLDALYASIEESLAKVAALDRPSAWAQDRDTPAKPSLLAAVEASLARVAAQSRQPWSDTSPSAHSLPVPSRPMKFRVSVPEAEAPMPAQRAARAWSLWPLAWLPRARLLAASALALLALVALLLAWRPATAPQAPAARVPPPLAAALPGLATPGPGAATARPRLEILTGIDSGTDARIATDLLRAVASSSEFDLRLAPQADWSQSVAGVQSGARLALMRYDALQAARRERAGELRIVAPLYTEELHFIARHDAPLRYVHQIEGARINVGPARGPRALTASALYERMFGKPMRLDAPASRLEEEAALAALLHGDSIDVMIVVGAQPAAWLADLEPAEKNALKLLELDRNHASSRAALRSFLPATLRPSSYRGWLDKDTPALSVMSFLVAGGSGAESAPVALFAKELCANLPELQRDGHPKWREVQPGLQLEAGWPYSSAAAQAFRSCQPQLSSMKGVRP